MFYPRRYWTVSLSLLVVVLIATTQVKAQHPKLMASLVLAAATSDEKRSESLMSLVQVDPETLRLVPFYDDSKAAENGLWPLSWSPNGEQLLFYRSEHTNPNDPFITGYTQQLCTLTKTGEFIGCFDAAPYHPFTGGSAYQLDTITWTADSLNVFYVTRTDNMLRLIEVNAKSGKEVNVIHEQQFLNAGTGYPNFLSWTSDLTLLGSGFAEPSDSESFNPELIYRTQINGKVTITRKAMRGVLDSFKEPFVCLNFSPLGTYISVLARGNAPLEAGHFQDLYLLDTQLNIIVHLDENNGFGRLNYGCPVWQPHEESFVFVTRHPDDIYIQMYKYTIKDRILTLIYNHPPEADLAMIINFLTVSPDGQFVAGVARDNVGGQVKVLLPDGKLYPLLGDYSYTQHPVWGN